MVSFSAAWARRILEQEKEKRGNCCIKCGSTEQLEFHHQFETELKGRGRGMPNRAIDIRKNPLSYILLCRTCHELEHPDLFHPVTVQDEVDSMERDFLNKQVERV